MNSIAQMMIVKECSIYETPSSKWFGNFKTECSSWTKPLVYLYLKYSFPPIEIDDKEEPISNTSLGICASNEKQQNHILDFQNSIHETYARNGNSYISGNPTSTYMHNK